MNDRTLVTGFGPFLNVKDNPSAKLARSCGRPFEVLDVSFNAVNRFLIELDRARFDRLLLLGVADGRHFVTPELFARNAIGRAPDVSGARREGPIDPGAPLLIEGTLWTPEILARIVVGRPMRVSYDAGNYLCNYTYFGALQQFPDRKVGFLHVPNEAQVPLEKQAQIVGEVLAAVEG